MPLSYSCDCSKERFEKGIASLGKKEIQKFVNEGNPVEITCQFCKKEYSFSTEELKKIKKNIK